MLSNFDMINPDIVLAKTLEGVAQRQPPSITSDTELISAADAMSWATKALRSTSRAKAVLDGHLLDGRLNAYCDDVIEEADFGPVGRAPPNAEATSRSKAAKRWGYLMHSFWRDNIALLDGSPPRNWDTGIFVRVEGEPVRARTFPGSDEVFIQARKRLVAHDVHFIRAQIDTAIEANMSPGAKRRNIASAKRRATGALTKAQWAKIVRPLQMLADNGDLLSAVPTLDSRGGLEELKREIMKLGELEHDPERFSPSTVQRRAWELKARNDEVLQAKLNQHEQS